MKICIVRHGETDWNAIGKLQGREDIPLNEKGREQAKSCATALQNGNWQAVVTSTLSRAKQTAEVIANTLNIAEIHEDFNLIERDYGKASGLTPEERNKRFPDGKYEGYEQCEPLRDRVCGSLKKWAEEFYPNDIIIVSHGAAINAILAEISDGSLGTGKTVLRNACMCLFTYENGKFAIDYYDKTHDEVEVF